MTEDNALLVSDIAADLNPWWQDVGSRSPARERVGRDLLDTLLGHVRRSGDRRSALLIGPRQVGKTTLLWQIADRVRDEGWPAKNVTYFNFDDDRLTSPVTVRDVADLAPAGADPNLPRILLLDEISRAERWEQWLKGAVDLGAARVIATDSAATILRGAGRESGLGRWDEYRLEGLSFREYLRILGQGEESEEATLQRLPNALDRYLASGGFPEHAFAEDLFLVRSRLRSDIADRAIRRDLSNFIGRGLDVERVVRLLTYLLQDSGAILNVQARSRDLGADGRTLRNWLEHLQDTMLVTRLEPWSMSATAALRASPRIYASDHALITAFSPVPRPLEDSDVLARVYEAVVFRHLRDLLQPGNATIGYFRRDDQEIDFVLSGDFETTAVEVTSSPSSRRDKVNRFRLACDALRVSRRILIHGGPATEMRGAMELVSLADFLMQPERIFNR